jgi:hypothetical protein
MGQPVSVRLMLDKSLYARTNTYGYKGYIDPKTKVTFKSGDFIGIIYSWQVTNNILYLQAYANINDYNNFHATIVPILEFNLEIPQLKEAVELENKKKQMQADVAKKETVGTVQFYVEKYGPWLLGAIVVVGVLPSLIKSFINPSRNEK